MSRLLLRLRLLCLRQQIAQEQHNCAVTEAEMAEGPQRLAHFKARLQALQEHAAAITQRLS